MIKKSAFIIQKSVILALFIREMHARFGRFTLGYFWALIEPAAHVFVLYFIFSIAKKSPKVDIDIPVFLITGIIPWLMFRSSALRSVTAISKNAGLFNYKPIKPFDAILVRIFLEFTIYSLSYVILLYLTTLFGFKVVINDISGLILTWIIFYFFCLGISLIFGVMGCLYFELEKFMPVIIRPLYFLSGVFFSIENIPSKYRDILLLNPLMHFMELFRQHFCNQCYSRFGDIKYIIMFTLVSLFLSLLLYRSQYKRLIVKAMSS